MARAGNAFDESHALGLMGVPQSDAGLEEEGEESAEEMQRKMHDAMLLNEQLDAMLSMRACSAAAAAAAVARTAATAGGVVGRDAPRGSGRPPHRPRAQRRLGRHDPPEQANRIHKDNAILVSKLTRIANGRPRPVGPPPGPHRGPAAQSAAAINRRKKDDQIARENAAMARRLNNVKPTGSLSAKAAAKHAAQHRQYLRITQRPVAPLSPAPLAPMQHRAARGSSAAASRTILPAIGL